MQLMSLTFTLQFAIQWINVFLLRTIILLNWIHSVIHFGNVIAIKALVVIVLLEVVIRGISIFRIVYSFEIWINEDRYTQDSIKHLPCKVAWCIVDRNLPLRMTWFIFDRDWMWLWKTKRYLNYLHLPSSRTHFCLRFSDLNQSQLCHWIQIGYHALRGDIWGILLELRM